MIDTDTHITEPGVLEASRLPARFKDSAPQIVRDPETQIETWRIGDGEGLLPVGHAARIGPRIGQNAHEFGRLFIPHSAMDTEIQLKRPMSSFKIEYPHAARRDSLNCRSSVD